MTHNLKIWPQNFCRVKDGSKTFEVRKNDRGFQCGDLVCLNEFDPDLFEPRFTGKSITFLIGFVLPVVDDLVVFSLLPMPDED